MSRHVHDYQIINDNNDGTLEICKECRKRLITTKGRDGRINNSKYLTEHERDTAQPIGRTASLFKRIYGNPNS